MKRVLLFVTLFISIVGMRVKADTDVMHFVFTGQSEDLKTFELQTYNRIVFGEKSMYVTSSANPNFLSEEMPYTLFNHIEVTNLPSSGIDDVAVQNGALLYCTNDKSLTVVYDDDRTFDVWIFNSIGLNVCRQSITAGEKIYLTSYSSGVYIAVAVSDDIQLKTKFII